MAKHGTSSEVRMDEKHYVPILKAKRGEFQALQKMQRAVKLCFTPLLEIPPVPWDYAREGPLKTIDGHLASFPPAIQKAWGTRRVFFVDAFMLEGAGRTARKVQPLAHLFDKCRQLGLLPVPVTGFDRTRNYQRAVHDVIARDHRGCCLRITTADLDAGAFPQARMASLLRRMGLGPEEVDLLVDFGFIQDAQLGGFKLVVPTWLGAVPDVLDWRSLILAACGFPPNLGALAQNAVSTIARTEWRLWDHVVKGKAALSRVPTFSDYAVAHPELSAFDPRFMIMIPNIRYTRADEWLVARGVNPKKVRASQQYQGLCQTLLRTRQCQAARFSWGDRYLRECARGQGGPGNATTWRTVGTSHHLAFVVNQIANHPGL